MADRWRPAASHVLQVRGLHVYYGQSHALQGVDLTLAQGVHAVVGRNGMGKTTLCNAITGLLRPERGSIRFHGEEITGLAPYRIAARGIGYTPQGRRLWPSLTVEEHFRIAETGGGAWTVERIYETFPRLYERRRNGAGQLSGGEQQMLAIGRALMTNPRLLILDEATEGLAPVVRKAIWSALTRLAGEGLTILVVDKNLDRLLSLSDRVVVLERGRVAWSGDRSEARADRRDIEALMSVQ